MSKSKTRRSRPIYKIHQWYLAINLKSAGIPVVPPSGEDPAVVQQGRVRGRREVANSRPERDMGRKKLFPFSIAYCYSVVVVSDGVHQS